MSKKLLIDSAHKEETRVALVDEQNRLTEYDIETTNKQTIKGNVYLAKVMRVEPSLQAAFVDYGGNRHGFLAFSEIHPDYFRIPVSDREVLAAKLVDAAENVKKEELEKDEEEEKNSKTTSKKSSKKDEESTVEVEEYDSSVSTIAGESVDHSDDDHSEDARRRRPALHKMYKIQEVVHKNQILLIQVAKEERGQKGAALTTYLSLAGRYCVLMPNSPQAGGISRKISNPKERKSLRECLTSLDLPKEMGLIIRTAGRGRTKAEIKRDTDYLTRQWNEIREETLKSIAPSLIYEEDSIIKRVIRDQYSKEISQVLVAGEACYKLAKSFMRKLMPSHAKNIIHYKDSKIPLFIEHKIEEQVEKMHDSTVMLPSGGSIVINPTEALVSIDINSGKATRERHIEETAFNTNIEAAVEIARQVRLRDLAGLVVIDFIDMDDRKYIQQVERKVRESFKNDRARVQMSKISPFGLLELSRQRLRPSMLETSSTPCPHCHATGHIRSTESMALLILRALEEEGIANRSVKIKAIIPTAVAFYILNEKRDHLMDIEKRHGISIAIEGDHALIAPNFRMLQVESRGSAGGNEEKEQKKPDSNRPSNRRRAPNPRHKPKTEDQKPVSEGGEKTQPEEKPKTENPEKTEGTESQPKRNQNRRRSNHMRRRDNRRPNPNKPQENKTPSETGQKTDVKKETQSKPQDSKKQESGDKKPAPQKVASAPVHQDKKDSSESKPVGDAPKKPAPRRRKSWLKKLLE